MSAIAGNAPALLQGRVIAHHWHERHTPMEYVITAAESCSSKFAAGRSADVRAGDSGATFSARRFRQRTTLGYWRTLRRKKVSRTSARLRDGAIDPPRCGDQP